VKQRTFFRDIPFVLFGMFVFILAWFEGCGGFVVVGGSPITGAVVDAVTKLPVPGALVVLEQADASGTDRIVASTLSASNGSFGLDPPSPGIFDVVADATVTSASGTAVTYAATVTFGVPANAKLKQIPLVPEFGNATPNGFPATISATVSSSSNLGVPSEVDVKLSALQPVAPAVGLVSRITIPAFAGSTTSITTMPNLSCASGTACDSYSLLVPAGNFSAGTFSASGTQYELLVQQPAEVIYTVEGLAFFHGAAISPDCTPSSMTSGIVIVRGTLASTIPDLTFTSCL
jgi:hypothetical protein